MAEGEPRPLLVVRHAWHTGLVLRTADLPAGSPLRPADAPEAAWVELGFGDRQFYTTPEPTLGMATRAALWPSEGVIAVAPHHGPAEAIPGEELLALEVPAEGLARLQRRLEAGLLRDAAGRPRLLARSPDGAIRFYAAREPFHLLRTCNVWTAVHLAEAGVPVSPALGAGELLARLAPSARRLRRLGRRVAARARRAGPPRATAA